MLFKCFNLWLKRLENNVGKGENAGYQHFSFSHIVFKSLLFQGPQKPGFFCIGLSKHPLLGIHILSSQRQALC